MERFGVLSEDYSSPFFFLCRSQSVSHLHYQVDLHPTEKPVTTLNASLSAVIKAAEASPATEDLAEFIKTLRVLQMETITDPTFREPSSFRYRCTRASMLMIDVLGPMLHGPHHATAIALLNIFTERDVEQLAKEIEHTTIRVPGPTTLQ